VKDLAGHSTIHFESDANLDFDQRFMEADPPVMCVAGNEITIHCEYNATTATRDLTNPVEMCLFYMHVDEGFEVLPIPYV